MALVNKWCPCVFFFALAALFGSCTTTEDGVQSELFIFSEFCAMKQDKGPCKAIKDRFYFNIDTGRCEGFEYGGCGGNDNNFKTLEACEEHCMVSADKSPCHLEEAPGPCRGMLTRYFFDTESQECKYFFYGGCFGNANNFRSMADCRAKCQNTRTTKTPEVYTALPTGKFNSGAIDQPLLLDASVFSQPQTQQAAQPHPTDFVPPEYCLSALDVGTCDRNETRFAYNPKTQKCHMFKYSGCGGNQNNFTLKRHCMRKCMNICKRCTDKKGMIRIRRKNLSNILFPKV